MVVDIAVGSIVIALLLGVYRVLKGPTWGDRIAAFDFLGVSLAAFVVVLALKTGYTPFLDAALIISILGFLSMVALARYLLWGEVMR